MPSFTVRPGLTIELRHGNSKPRDSLTLADFVGLDEVDVSAVKDPETKRGKLIKCRIKSSNNVLPPPRVNPRQPWIPLPLPPPSASSSSTPKVERSSS